MGTTDRLHTCETCGGSRLSGTGHKIWCSGHILAPKSPEWVRRAKENRLPVADKTGQAAA